MSNRARVIYQSEALYAGTVDATGHHFTVNGTGYKDLATAEAQGTVETGIEQLHRVQSANYSFSINRQDVNQFGQLARIDSVSIEPPTVTLDFSYYLTNGFNEKVLGFNIDGGTDEIWSQALSDELLLGKTDKAENPGGKNFFILTTAEGKDAVKNTTVTAAETPEVPGTPEVPATSDSLTHDGVTYTAVTAGAASGITITINDNQVSDEITAVGADITVSLTGDVNARTQQDILTAFGSAAAGVTSLINITVAAAGSNLATTISSEALTGGTNLVPEAPTTPAVTTADDANSTIALGNGFVSNYSIEASVGGMPTASVTIDGLNLRSYVGTVNLDNPAINTTYGIPVTDSKFSLPPAVSGKSDAGENGIWGDADDTQGDAGIACLRPGDISLSLGFDGRAGEFELLPSKGPANDYEGSGSAHIQSFSIDAPISRSVINRLGNPYGYARVTDFPVNISVSVSAILSDLKEGNVADLLFNEEQHDLTFTMREPDPQGTGNATLIYKVKGARLEGESFSSSIGDNKSVDLTFTAQLGGPEDKTNGLFISGSAA